MDEESFQVRDHSGVVVWHAPRNALQPLELGLVYEKHVGQYLQAQGYDVDFRGLQMGLLDGGVDLVASRGTDRPLFVQCKYKSRSKLSLQRIERILYRGGNFIAREASNTARCSPWPCQASKTALPPQEAGL